MICCTAGGRTLGQFALVSYIPDPLGRFLDDLRTHLTPGSKPRAHVTVLPPRPLTAEIDKTVKRLAEESQSCPPFDVSLGDIKVFPKTNVLYLSLARGEHELHALHENLNTGQLEYDGPFPYHPHVTIAQDISPDDVPRLLEEARRQWAKYDGPRSFPVEILTFVQNVAPLTWVDIAAFPLAVPVLAR